VSVRKTAFLVGAGIGFILGSRTGRGPYQQLESKVREVTRRPEVQSKVEQLKDTAKSQAGAAAQKAGWSDASGGDEHVAPPNWSPQSYVDPQDLQFSAAAARKEEMVDGLLAQGVPPADLEQKEEELREAGALTEPPAGSKAKPVKDG
jgi:hypothetical protein